MLFEDRFEAGQFLATKLIRYRRHADVIVLALPRGGVPVAFEVAKALEAPLDVFFVRKLGYPAHPELAMGAIAANGVQVLHEDVVDRLQISAEVIERVAQRERKELQRQQELFRRSRAATKIAGRTVILVDDGLATGSTMRAAVQAIKSQRPKWLVVAVPIGSAETCAEFAHEVDDVVCAARPEDFRAVGVWYHDFSPTPDEHVQSLLQEAVQWSDAESGAAT